MLSVLSVQLQIGLVETGLFIPQAEAGPEVLAVTRERRTIIVSFLYFSCFSESMGR